MSKIIEGVPDFITYDQYLGIFESCGIDPRQVAEMRLAHDGVHVLVFAQGSTGARIVDVQHDCFYKHRVFIPVRRESDDTRTTRITEVKADAR